MGNEPSSERSSHFQHPEGTQAAEDSAAEDLGDEAAHVINISNKMAERLVEDNEIYKDQIGPTKRRNDTTYQDKMCMERLKILDESHTERHSMLPEDLDALVNRIHVRSARIAKLQPVCEDCKIELMKCYADNENDTTVCYDQVMKFKKCVADHTVLKLRHRIADLEDEQFRKSKDLEKARKYNYWANLEPHKTKT